MQKQVVKIIICGACAALTACHNGPAVQQGNNADTAGWPASFGFGRTADARLIAAEDIDVRPDGKGLPPGSGNAATGQTIYMAKCAACHGTGAEPPGTALPAPVLMNDSAGADFKKIKTIGNYWPYATTIFDYIRRTMPYTTPGSLTANEAYSLTAYLLYANKIIDRQKEINDKTLPAVVMPAQQLFITDPRKGGPEIQ